MSLKVKSLAFCFLLFTFCFKSQVNYVINGGFERIDSCDGNYCYIVFGSPWDTLANGGGDGYLMNTCFNPSSFAGVPLNAYGNSYQIPRSGNGYCYELFLKLTPNPAVNWRGYIQQQMAHTLIANKEYCVTYHVSLSNRCNFAVDELGAYFDNGSIHSIAQIKEAPANPQVKSPSNVFYMDTLGWMKVQGTFIANGTESHITLGNFRYTAATTYTSLDGATSGVTEYYIDDVSVIEVDLPAYAGVDVWGIPTNTAYIGRPHEIGLDDDCFWYKLPNTTTAIDTSAGITITVAATTETYMVKQDICGNIQYDTVVVFVSGVGLNQQIINSEHLKLYPNPADNIITIEMDLFKDNEFKLRIYNSLNQLIREEDLIFKEENSSIKTDDLECGVYFINLSNNKFGNVNKRIVIER